MTMKVNYDKDIVQVLKALDTEEFCLRFKNCTSCPLGKLNVFQTRTCDEIKKLNTRLILAYEVVKTL